MAPPLRFSAVPRVLSGWAAVAEDADTAGHHHGDLGETATTNDTLVGL
jgi:hypothetical protein